MSKTANELLQGILTTVSKIESKMEADKREASVGPRVMAGIGPALMSFSRVKESTKKSFVSFVKDITELVKKDKGKNLEYFSDGIIKISNALPDLVKSLTDLGRMKSRQVDSSLNTLKKLYDLMHTMGDGRSMRRVNNAIGVFERLGQALKRIATPLRMLSTFLAYLGMSFVVFALGIVTASAMLKGTSPLAVVGIVLGTIGAFVTAMLLLNAAQKLIKPGIDVIKGISAGFLYLSLGLLAFTMGLLLVANYLGSGQGWNGIWKGMLVMGTVVLIMVGMFALLGSVDDVVKKGVDVVKGMGFGLFILIGGVFLFAVGLTLIAKMLNEKDDAKGIALAMGIMALSVASMVGIFYLLGTQAKQVAMGTAVAMLVSIGIMAITFSVYYMATMAKQITDLGEEKNGGFRGVFKEIGPGLGIIGGIFVLAAGAFALLGIPTVAALVAVGTGVSLLISVSLIKMAEAVVTLSETASLLSGKNVSKQISDLVGSSISGLTEGLSKGLSGDKKGLAGVAEFIKRSAMLFTSIHTLRMVARGLSMFAKAISAFAELQNMRVIEGYDEKTGEPKFGGTVNVVQVAKNISTSISTFLSALIESTDGLTKNQSVAIKKMARALTGKRGILQGVIMFADALKVYSQFGTRNEIGYMTYDEKGGEIREFVKANVVVDNIISTFLYFTNKLFNRSEEEFGDGEPRTTGISGRQGRRMRKMAKALTGKHGILGAIIQFSEVLNTFSKYGEDNKLPILDEEGKPTGEYLKMSDIADNIVEALTTFSDTLADKLKGGQAKNATKALANFDNLIEKLNKLSTSMDGLTRLTNTITELAEGFDRLVISMNKLDTAKLEEISQKTAGAAVRPGISGATVTPGTGGTTLVPTPMTNVGSTVAAAQNWEQISNMIGEQVGQRVAASLRNGQFVFEFDTTKSGGIYYWQPR